jgi:hypothetical protein
MVQSGALQSRQWRFVALLLIVTLIAACGGKTYTFRNVDKSAVNVPAVERATIAGLGYIAAVDGRTTGVGRQLAPGRHTVWLDAVCGISSGNSFRIRLDLDFAPGHTYRVDKSLGSESKPCVVEIVEEPGGRLICRMETGYWEPLNRLTSSLDFASEACRAWTSPVFDYLEKAHGDGLPWPPPIPQPVAVPGALRSLALRHIWRVSSPRQWDDLYKQLQLQREIGEERPVFVVPHAVGLPRDPSGIVHGPGVLLTREVQPPYTAKENWIYWGLGKNPRPIDAAGNETSSLSLRRGPAGSFELVAYKIVGAGSLSLRLGPADTYRTRTIVVLFDDDAELGRFVGRLRTERPLTLDLDADPGWTIRYWDADDVLQPPRDGWRS